MLNKCDKIYDVNAKHFGIVCCSNISTGWNSDCNGDNGIFYKWDCILLSTVLKLLLLG